MKALAERLLAEARRYLAARPQQADSAWDEADRQNLASFCASATGEKFFRLLYDTALSHALARKELGGYDQGVGAGMLRLVEDARSLAVEEA